MSGDALRIDSLTPGARRALLARLLRERAGATGWFPLSFAQQRMWVVDRLGAGAAYNVPVVLRLVGRLDVRALRVSLAEIVRRHDVLRVTFSDVDGEPRQRLVATTDIEVPIVDLRDVPASERDVTMRRLATEETEQLFDLAAGPLIRARLLQAGENDHLLVVTLHHIVSDGWSVGVFIRDLTTFYRAHTEGIAAPVPPLPVQYMDFARWQRDQFQGEARDRLLGYWKRQLAGLPVLPLPADRARPSRPSFQGAWASRSLPAKLREGVKELGWREGATLFMTLLAGFQLLLQRYSGQHDVAVGTPIANRARREIEDLIGFFVNTLVMRSDGSGDPRFSEYLGRVRAMALDAFSHQDLAFERLVEELDPDRDVGRNPLVQVMFALQNAPMTFLEFAGVTVRPIELPGVGAMPLGVPWRKSRFDLELHVWERQDGLQVCLVYSTDLFDAATMTRMLGHYERVLEQVVENPERRLSEYTLLDRAERRQLVDEWNATASAYPRERCVHELFAEQAARTPDAIAVEYAGAALTYAELDRRADALAQRLSALGVGPEAMVGIGIERSLEMVVGLLGILKAGGAYLPLDPENPPARLEYMLQDSGAQVLLTQGDLGARLPRYAGSVVHVDDDSTGTRQSTQPGPRAPAGARDLAYVIYTSGSTGQPKGTLVEHRSVVRLVCGTRYVSFGPELRVLVLAPVSFDASTFELWGPLLHGGTCVLYPERVPTAGTLGRMIREHRITDIFLTTALFNSIVDEAPELLSPLRSVLTGGEACSMSHFRRALQALPDTRIVHVYGPTETTTFATAFAVPRDLSGLHCMPIGRPIANTTAYVLDDHARPVPVGVYGELYIGGPGVARGYLNREELTAERFVADPYSGEAGARLYRTGDLVRYVADGNLEFLGRIDTQVKLRGFRIELGEIEAALGQHAAVRQAVALVREDEPGEKRLVAYVVAGDRPPDLAESLRAHLRGRLPDYMIPAALVLLDQLPLSPNGKVDRAALPAPERATRAENYVAPRTPAEEIMAGIWAEVLGLDRIGIHENFFELGGHSLLATRVASRVRDAFGRELPLRALFEAPTVAEFAAALGGAGEEVDGAMRPLAPMDRSARVRTPGTFGGAGGRAAVWPMSFAQQRLWFLNEFLANTDAYHIPMAWRLRGKLDVGALEGALHSIHRRHDALRTTFSTIDDAPVQIVEDSASVTVPVEDLRSCSGVHHESTLRQRIAAICAIPFDLERGPLLRVCLLRTGDEEYILVVVIHHIVADGWSLEIFHNELAELYDAGARGRAATLPDLPIQYADFALWQREWLAGERLERQLAYWRAQLAGLQHLELPTDRPRPAVQRFRGASRKGAIAPELSRRLLKLHRKCGATLAMVIQAAFAVLLHRYTGQDDIVVGTPIANRTRREIEGLIGFFVNSLAIRTDLTGDPTFQELLGRVRDASLAAYAHQELPFEKLVEALQPVRDPSRNPIFQVWCAVQNARLDALALGELRGEPVDTGSYPTRFDLELHFWDLDSSQTYQILYNPDLFDEATIARFAGHFEQVLEAAVADPDRRVSALVVPLEEERRLFEAWNDTAVDYPAAVTLCSLFEAQVERTPTAPALRFENQQVSYRELAARADALARALVARGVGPDGLVGVYTERSIAMVVSLYAVLKAGGAYVPFETGGPGPRLARMVEDARPCIILTQAGLAANLRSALSAGSTANSEILVLDSAGRLIPESSGGARAQAMEHRAAEGLPAVKAGPMDLAYVIFTSGSTGRPKGVMVHHKAICNRLLWMQDSFPIGPGDRVLQKTPYTFDVSVWEFFWPLMVGAELVIAVPEGHKDPVYLADTIREAGITTLHFVPSMLQIFLSETQVEDLPLKRVFASGEALPGELAKAFLTRFPRCELHNLYGPTEAAVDVTYYACVPGDSRLNVPIGRPVANTQLYVLGHGMQPVPVGVPGELYLGGVQVARGYLNREELTAERFVADPYSGEAGARLYRTGDLVRYVADGNLEFLGRIDTQVKLRGFRIELGEIEAALGQHAAVRQAVALVREDEPGEKRLVAYVVAQEAALSGAGSGAEARQWSAEHVAEWRELYEQTYVQGGAEDAAFNITGWNSSYTGEAIPAAEMREWVEATVARIAARQPRRVLEIGCGTGLLLARLAPDCEVYVGTDFSARALDHARALIGARGDLGHVELRQGLADDFSGVESAGFDTVIINSVTQYLPGIEYLKTVLEGAVSALAAGGRIFVGDVRSLPLLRAFHASVQCHRADGRTERAKLRRLIDGDIELESELVIDPEFFVALRGANRRISDVEVFLKRGRHQNELTRFRYDVFVHVEAGERLPEAERWLDWSGERLDVAGLEAHLARGPAALGVRGMPNARLAHACGVLGWLETEEGPSTVGALRAAQAADGVIALEPEALRALAGRQGYEVELSYAMESAASMDAMFRKRESVLPGAVFGGRAMVDGAGKRWDAYANNPLRVKVARDLTPQLRRYLGELLPDYMVPTAFVLLPEIPLTTSGKVDRRALPAPGRALSTATYIAPRTSTEKVLAGIWAEVLGRERIGIHDNFFELGGHSLLATQVVSKANRHFGLRIVLTTLFDEPTLGGFADCVAMLRSAWTAAAAPRDADSSERVRI